MDDQWRQLGLRDPVGRADAAPSGVRVVSRRASMGLLLFVGGNQRTRLAQVSLPASPAG